jgi:hypothetical protein
MKRNPKAVRVLEETYSLRAQGGARRGLLLQVWGGTREEGEGRSPAFCEQRGEQGELYYFRHEGR